MSKIQLDRLIQDSNELQAYAEKLKNRGKEILYQKILAKRQFLDNRIKEAY
jgi:phage shock protein A